MMNEEMPHDQNDKFVLKFMHLFIVLPFILNDIFR